MLLLLIPKKREDKSHVQMICSIELNPLKYSTSTSSSRYCFKKADFDSLRESLSTINWADQICGDDIDDMVGKLYEILYGIFDEHVPKVTPRVSNCPIWYDKKILNLKNIRNKEFNRLCKNRMNNRDADDSDFCQARDDFDNYQKQLYERYVKDLAENSKNDSKKFWSMINGKRKSNSLPCKLTYETEIATTDQDKANLFSKFFQSVYANHEKDNDLMNFINSRDDSNCFKFTVSQDMIFNTLKAMDLNKGMSPDFVAPIFLRECADFLVEPLYTIYSKSLDDYVYPQSWKMGYITPIFKAGKKSDVTNYRGVSIMPNLAKVFEIMIHKQMRLIVDPLLSKRQHGFLSSRCIETNMHGFTTFLFDCFEQEAQADAFYADIRKAFDRVIQSRLIRKLDRFPLSNGILKWFISYFEGRKQCVNVCGTKSEEFPITSGVGQGTILGPLLFLIFFNDSDDGIDEKEVETFNFADDKKQACLVKNRFDGIKLQNAIDKFIAWCDENGLEVNSDKCHIISFSKKRKIIEINYTIRGKTIDRVSKIRDLGVMLDHKLDFHSHIEFAKKKAEMALGFVKRQCRNKLGKDIAKLLYSSDQT